MFQKLDTFLSSGDGKETLSRNAYFLENFLKWTHYELDDKGKILKDSFGIVHFLYENIKDILKNHSDSNFLLYSYHQY
jgi:hypothetical protein